MALFLAMDSILDFKDEVIFLGLAIQHTQDYLNILEIQRK